MKTFLNNHRIRGLRNNNPGNLKKTNIGWQGKIPHGSDAVFEQFENIYWGLRAMYKDLINDINKGKNTVRLLISEYAPPSENNTKIYIQNVCKSIGVTPDQKLTKINGNFLVELGRAILMVELGSSHSEITTNDLKKSIGMLGNVSTDLLKVDTTNFFFFNLINLYQMKEFIRTHKLAVYIVAGLIITIIGVVIFKRKK